MLFAVSLTALAQNPDKLTPLSPNAPEDRFRKLDEEKKFDAVIKPYVEQALKAYPEAKARYLAGLPEKHIFFVTTRLRDAAGNWEQVFVEVKEINEGKINGLIANDINTVSGYKLGDKYSLKETEVLDWTIAKPDGSEEGNYVGKFLDTYKPKE
jgi:hypothetical protein